MVDQIPDETRSLTLSEGLGRSGLSVAQVHADYLAMGGKLPQSEIAEALEGKRALDRYEHNKLAAALNEHFTEADQDHPVGYDDSPVPDGDPG